MNEEYNMSGLMTLKPKILTPEAYRKYGKLISLVPSDPPAADDEKFTAWLDVMKFNCEHPRTVILLTEKRREYVLTQMERHVKTFEYWVPIRGETVAAFAEGIDINNPDEVPDVKKIEVFRMEGIAAYTTNPGVWHYPAFPISDVATQLVDVKVGTVEEDIDMKPLSELVYIEI
jgi:ureidoglycolate hydrolase